MNTLVLQLKQGDQVLLNIEAPTSARPHDVLDALKSLFDDSLPKSVEKKEERKFGKYSPLALYLQGLTTSVVVLTFEEVEGILAFVLPDSADGYRAWWANDVTHSQARAWISVGWQTTDVDLVDKKVKFVRSELKKELDYMKNFETKRVSFLSLGKLRSTSNGNKYLECETSEGTIAVWGSPKNRKNIEALQQRLTPFAATISCIPGNWERHNYWVPEVTEVFFAEP